MSNVETAFQGGISDSFAEYAGRVRGYIRYQLVQESLGTYICDQQLSVADIGGGAGIDALWLAEEGHQVAIVDPAADQLQKARDRFADTDVSDAVRQRVTFRSCTSKDLLKDGRAGSFDLVLSHGVAMYLPEPETFVSELVQLVRPGGYVSLLEKGFYGAYTTLVNERRFDAALSLAETRKFKNHMDRDVWAFTPDELEEYLHDAGASVLSWSGVRIGRDSDNRPIDEVPKEELAAIVEDEAHFGVYEATRGMGQMLHFIAQKA